MTCQDIFNFIAYTFVLCPCTSQWNITSETTSINVCIPLFRWLLGFYTDILEN